MSQTKQNTHPQGKMIIAADPGKSGAIAVFHQRKILTYALKNTDPYEILRGLANGAGADTYSLCGYMEKVGGFIPDKDGEGQPGSRMFTFGESYGELRAIFRCEGIPLKMVLPQVWQRGIAGRKGTYNDRKKALYAHAKRLFPELTFGREEADALCILHYALFQEGVSNEGYSAPLVANADDSAAVKWCKANGWPVPAYGTPNHAEMVKAWHKAMA